MAYNKHDNSSGIYQSVRVIFIQSCLSLVTISPTPLGVLITLSVVLVTFAVAVDAYVLMLSSVVALSSTPVGVVMILSRVLLAALPVTFLRL